MKKASIPPFIIFLDLLFMFLFIFILNEDKKIKVEVNGNSLPNNAKIIYKHKNNYYYTNSTTYTPVKNFYYHADCNSHILECKKAKAQYGKEIHIVYPKNIQDEIADFLLITIGTGKCNRLTFFIKEESLIDYKKMIKLYPCIKKIPGYKTLLK